MGYFSEILAEPAAQQAGRMTFNQLYQRGVVGGSIWDSLAKQAGIPAWEYTGGGNNEGGSPIGTGQVDPALVAGPLSGYTFDWQDTGPANTGTLTAYDPTGKLYGAFSQQDQTGSQAFGEWAALAGAGFGGAALAGFGPLAGAFGGAAGAANPAVGNGAFLGEAAIGSGTAGGGTVGGGLTAGGTYGTIGANSAALGAGGAGLSSGAGIAAPAFAGGGSGLVGGLGMTAGAGAAAGGAGGLSGILSGIGGYLPAAQSLASIASGVYGMKLAGDARKASDPFAPYRGAYGERLAALEANPGSIVSRPGFQAGLGTIERKSASSGYYGSGNMASALGRYSGDFYNQEANRLATLAGAGQTPGAGQMGAAELAGQSLGSIGYGVGPLLERLLKGG